MIPKIYLSLPEPHKSCLLSMRDILLGLSTDVTETVKYGMPCFLYKGKIAFYLWTDKNTGNPYFLIADGNKIDHPSLFSGNRKRMKTLSVNPNEDLHLTLINDVLNKVIDLYETS